MGRTERITKAVKGYDSLLYCEEGREGKLCVFRKSQRVESYDVNGQVIHFIRPAPYLVFALTDSWNINGIPRDWGIEPIMMRLKTHDLWNRDVAKESLASVERESESRDRAVDNHIESYLLDNRREFAKATNDINTSGLAKTDKRKTMEKKNGYCK